MRARLVLLVGLMAAFSSSRASLLAEEAAPPPLVHEIVLPVAPRVVWEALTTAEGWKKLGVAKADVDLRIGGRIRSHYDPAGTLGDEKTIENEILAFEPGRLLAIRVAKAPKGFPFPADVVARTWSVMELDDLGDGRTRLSIRGHGYGTDEASQRMRAFFEKGNAMTLQLLAKALGGAATPSGDLAPVEATIQVPAAVGDVYRAWTTAEGWKAFLGTDARIELRPGGPFEVEFAKAQPAGLRGSEGCTVLAWLPGRMVAFSWNAPPQFAHARATHAFVVVEFEAEGPASTRVRLVHAGFAEHAAANAEHADEWRAVRAYFAKAWPQVLGALRAHFAG